MPDSMYYGILVDPRGDPYQKRLVSKSTRSPRETVQETALGRGVAVEGGAELMAKARLSHQFYLSLSPGEPVAYKKSEIWTHRAAFQP